MKLPFLEEPLPHTSLQSHEWDQLTTVSRIDENTIYKPRPLYWEWLFLCPNSFLRVELKKIFIELEKTSPLLFLADLDFLDIDQLKLGGRVSFLHHTHITKNDILEDRFFFEKIGTLLGFLCWFGLKDNFTRNIIFGKCLSGRILLTPIDVEKVFNKISLPSQTGFLPKSTDLKDIIYSGLQKVFKIVSIEFMKLKVAHIISGYINCIEVLKKNEDFLDRLIIKEPGLDQIPIRVGVEKSLFTSYIFKGRLQFEDFEDQFSPGEIEQINMNVNPQFFRFLKSDDLFYTDRNNHFQKDLFVKTFHSPSLKVSGDLFIDRPFNALKSKGINEIAKFFCPMDFSYYSHKNVVVKYWKNIFQVKNGKEIIFEV